MLLLMMFCTTFFVLPAVGMMLLAIKKLNKERREAGCLYLFDDGQAVSAKKQRKDTKVVFPRFANKHIIEYQLIESQIRESLHFREIKPRAPCRAGP